VSATCGGDQGYRVCTCVGGVFVQCACMPPERWPYDGEVPTAPYCDSITGQPQYLGGETLHGLSKRHDVSRQLIRVWVEKYEAGALDEDAQAADLLKEYEAKIAALERMVGRQVLEIEFLKGALRNAPRPRSATTSVIAGPPVSPSQKDAG